MLTWTREEFNGRDEQAQVLLGARYEPYPAGRRALVAAIAFASVEASSAPHWLNVPIFLIIVLCLPSIGEVLYRATHRGNDDE